MQKSTWIIDIIYVIGVTDTNIRMLLIMEKESSHVLTLKIIPYNIHPIRMIELALINARIKPSLIIVDDRKEVLDAYNTVYGPRIAKHRRTLFGIKIIDEKGKLTSKPQEDFKRFLINKIETSPHTQTLTIPEFEDYYSNICVQWNFTRRRVR
jgi:hypothetical protein